VVGLFTFLINASKDAQTHDEHTDIHRLSFRI
jgi:hypothetical protein